MENDTENLQSLYMRHRLCDSFIRILNGLDDPRKESALEYYKAQLKEIDSRITEAEKIERAKQGLPEPEPVVVGLKSAILSAIIPK